MTRKFGRAKRSNNAKKTHHPRKQTMHQKLYEEHDEAKRQACLRKRPMTKTQARSAAAHLNTRPSIYSGEANRPVHAYDCPYCSHWHIGRVPRWSSGN